MIGQCCSSWQGETWRRSAGRPRGHQGQAGRLSEGEWRAVRLFYHYQVWEVPPPRQSVVRGLSEGICLLEKMSTWIESKTMECRTAMHCCIASLCLYFVRFISMAALCLEMFTLDAAANMPAQCSINTDKLAPSSASDHLMAGALPGCGAFFESATMPNPMATSMPQPAMSYHTSLTPPFVAVLPPDPPPPPSVMVYSRHQAHVSHCAIDVVQICSESDVASPSLNSHIAQWPERSTARSKGL